MLQLERVVRRPSVAHVGVESYRTVEPLARLGVLAIRPKLSGYRGDDVRFIIAPLESLQRLACERATMDRGLSKYTMGRRFLFSKHANCKYFMFISSASRMQSVFYADKNKHG